MSNESRHDNTQSLAASAGIVLPNEGEEKASSKKNELDDFQVLFNMISYLKIALIDAIRSGDMKMFERIGVHKNSFEPNFIIDETGNFPLLYACQMGQ